MMKTPDEIKKGLRQCGENTWCAGPDCPYYETPECHAYIARDALAYIQRLERERDAAVEALSRYKKCIDCKYWPIVVETSSFCDNCESGNNWQWRGVQEAE